MDVNMGRKYTVGDKPYGENYKYLSKQVNIGAEKPDSALQTDVNEERR